MMQTGDFSPRRKHRWGAWLFAALSLVIGGCVPGPYRYGSAQRYYTSPELASVTETQIERGAPRPVLDGVGWVVGIPTKILLWNRKMDNHHISPETEAAVADYLAANELTTVKVRLNQYNPRDDWRRLVANKSVGWGWRYSLGTLSWLGEALLPGRIFGGDHYNPFTNTVHVYSDLPAIAIHEGGHAKDFARRRYKGTYAAVYLLPVTPLWYEGIATGDALGYLHAHGELDEEEDAYRVLYPAYGTYVGNAMSNVIPAAGTPFYIAGVVSGHIVGRIQARQLEKSKENSTTKSETPAVSDAPLITEVSPSKN
jgi:hypothetical protein